MTMVQINYRDGTSKVIEVSEQVAGLIVGKRTKRLAEMVKLSQQDEYKRAADDPRPQQLHNKAY